MSLDSVLIANRGEIAVRIARAAADLGLRSVSVYATDDADSLHTQASDDRVALGGAGAAAYLDGEALVNAAREAGCQAVHPGYGFLSEQAAFARQCESAGLTFIGPTPAQLALFGDKAEARAAATRAGVPLLPGTDKPVSLPEAEAFFSALPAGAAMIIKAIAGGGGRGTRVVTAANAIADAFERCRSEAAAAFGQADVYLERYLPRARHIEVQVVGDGSGAVSHLYERECSVQRRHQKVVELAPAIGLDAALRRALIDAALRLARQEQYRNVGTFEFLVAEDSALTPPFVFIEANARLQVEHTVTEAVTGVDLVQTQLRLASGATLAELGLDDPERHQPRGCAVQARVNRETLLPDGTVRPSGGRLSAYDPPSGPGVRTDGFAYAGFEPSNAYDSLLAKVIAHGPDLETALRRATRALGEFRIEGTRTNIPFLENVLTHPELARGAVYTTWVDEHLATLAQPSPLRRRFQEPPGPENTDGFAGARVDSRDPLALFAYDAQAYSQADARAQATAPEPAQAAARAEGQPGTVALTAPIQGTLVAVSVAEGDAVGTGQSVAIVEAMKMEHVISAEESGYVRAVTMTPGDVVREGFPIVYLEPADVAAADSTATETLDLDHIRSDLQENRDRHGYTLDENRPEAVARRHNRGHRMPRENVAELMDPGSFKEYWPLIVARQHSRFDPEQLRRNTPADGVVAGIGTINAGLFGEEAARAMLVHYDYTVLAGTQGARNHYKQDRMFELAHRFRLPLVLFGEGGGGRPGDDSTGPAVAFDTHTFTQFSKLSGLVPLVAVTNGRCFAGNTALVACSDVIIATEGSTLAMGGPAMIEGGGLGVYTPEEVGPMSFQVPNGVVDLLVKDEAAAVQAARQYLSFFQGRAPQWSEPDQRRLRHVVPENRLRLYDMREVIDTLADEGSVLELRRAFGVGVITAFARIEGHPVGILANNPHHLAGAIDSDGADKGARFLQLCDAFDIPVVSLIDCPGMMVGPEVEKTALVRHCTRMFNTGANLTTPLFGVVVRKAYGLGAQAMCGASALVGFFIVAWPTAEFAGMNIEGAVKLGYRKELMAIEDPEERLADFERRVERAYDHAKAVNAAAGGGLDDVIDPAETRSWLASSLKRLPPAPPRTEKKYPFVDTW